MLLEVILQLQFEALELPQDRLHFFYDSHNRLLQNSRFSLTADTIELRSTGGVTFPKLRYEWTNLLRSFFKILKPSLIKRMSLSYLNEIPLEDLKDFRNYLNISIEMPASLKEKFEFFRSEFTYKYDFGEIKVWLQPDWNDRLELYCIQLNLESHHRGGIQSEGLFDKLQEMHEGMKDIFGQLLSKEYIRQLPQ